MRAFPRIVVEMQQIQLTESEDKAIGIPDRSGTFSIASCYELLRVKSEKVQWRNLVWAKSVFPRHGFIFWLAVKGRLKTKDLIARKGISKDGRCIFCLTAMESCGHLFFECFFTKGIWKEVLAFLGIIRTPQCWSREKRWLFRKCRGRGRLAISVKAACAATVYELWQERNRRLFTKKTKD